MSNEYHVDSGVALACWWKRHGDELCARRGPIRDYAVDSSPSRCFELPFACLDQLEMPTALKFGTQSVQCQENCETCQLY